MIDELLHQIEEEKKSLLDIIDKDTPNWAKETLKVFRAYLSEGKYSEDERDFFENNKQVVIRFCLLFDIYVPLSHLNDYIMAKYDLNTTMEVINNVAENYGRICEPEEVYDILKTIPLYNVPPVLMFTKNHLALEKNFKENNKEGFLEGLRAHSTGVKKIQVYCKYIADRNTVRSIINEIAEKGDELSEQVFSRLQNNVLIPIAQKINNLAEIYNKISSEEELNEILDLLFGNFLYLSPHMYGWHIEYSREIIKKGSYLAPYFMPIYFEVLERIIEGSNLNLVEIIKAQYDEDSNEYKALVMSIQEYRPSLYAKIDSKQSSKKSTRGRKTGTWLMIDCKMTEEELRMRFESDIYPSLEKALNEFKLKKKLKNGAKELIGKARENTLKYLRACFVYYTAELLHIAYPISSTKNQEHKPDFINSLARTLDVNKTTFQKYYKIFDKYEQYLQILYARYNVEKQIETLQFGDGWHLIHNNNIKPDMKLLASFLKMNDGMEESDINSTYQILELNIEKFKDVIAELEKTMASMFGVKLDKRKKQ